MHAGIRGGDIEMLIVIVVFGLTFIIGISLMAVYMIRFFQFRMRPFSDEYYAEQREMNESMRNLIQKYY